MGKRNDTQTACDLGEPIRYEGNRLCGIEPAMVSVSPSGRVALGQGLCVAWPKDKPYVCLLKFSRDPAGRLFLEPATLADAGSLRLRREARVAHFDAFRALDFLGLRPPVLLHARGEWLDGRLAVDLAGAEKIERPARSKRAAPDGAASAPRPRRRRVTCPAGGRDCAAVRDERGRVRPFKHRDPDGIECSGGA